MLYRELIAVCSEIHTKHINILCGQMVKSLNVKPGGTYSDHCAVYTGVPGGKDLTSGECSLGQTITI